MKLLFLGSKQDEPYAASLKSYIAGNPCLIYYGAITTKSEVVTLAASKGIEAIITTNISFLKLLSGNPKASVDNYAGSLFHLTNTIEVLIIPPLDQLLTVTTGKHILARYLEKLFRKDKWFKQTPLTWEIANESSIDSLFQQFKSAYLISVDIETRKENLRVTCVGYCGIFRTTSVDGSNAFTTHSIVIPFTSEFFVAWCDKFNNLPAAKIMQNGQYDCSYFLRYNIPPTNYLYDTLNLFHCWYAELPKKLDFIVAYCIRDFIYWKDEAESATNIEDYYFYNAKDTWATANVFLALMHEMPQWALDNYKIEFPTIFPALHAAMEGLKVDKEERDKLFISETAKLNDALGEVRKSLGSPAFNPGSWQQVKKLYSIFGCEQIASTNAKDMKKAALLHPLNDWFFSRIIKYREAAKLLSSYLDADLLNGRFMYSLNPAGTDTGRLTSRESAFWCGGNVQQTPAEVKSMYIPDEGWLFAEIDYKQSEAWCVAFVSGDEKLLAAVQNKDRDFHANNASMFFGVTYESIMQEEADKKRDKTTAFTTRDLSKRTNHGASYNMGDTVMLDTMGLVNVLRAKKLLKLPEALTPKQVCKYLLDCYADTYKHVKGRWYDKVKMDVTSTSLLRSALGWTRFCFGKPAISKPALNSYVAHVPQNLSVSILNIAWIAVWKKFGLTGRIRIKAQGHDALLFEYRVGDEAVVPLVAKMMEVPVAVTGSDGVVRTMTIPNDVKLGLRRWREI